MIIDLALGFEEFPVNFLGTYADLIEACSDDSVLIHLEYDYEPGNRGFGSAYPAVPSSLVYDSHVIEVPYKSDQEHGQKHDARVEKFLEIAMEYATDWLYLNRWAVDKIGERHLAEYEEDMREMAIDESGVNEAD